MGGAGLQQSRRMAGRKKDVMTERGVEKLHTLLFGGERELVNIKFFPGSDRGLTADQLAGEAESSISTALAGDLVDNPPLSGVTKASLT
jgi:hypothetical protein